MLDINFETDSIAKFKVSSGDEVSIEISYFSNDGEGWEAHIDMRSPSSKSRDEYLTTLGYGYERSTIVHGFEHINVQVTREELDAVVKKTREFVNKSWPRISAHDSYFGI